MHCTTEVLRVLKDIYIYIVIIGTQMVVKATISVGKLENHGNLWCNWIPVWRPRNRGANGVCPDLSPKARETEYPCQREGEDGYLSSGRQSDFALPVLFQFYLVPQQIDDTTHTGDGICFTHFTNSNASLRKKHPHRHTQK